MPRLPHLMGYSRAQIRLHWLVAVLIALQYLLHEPIVAAWRAFRKGEALAFQPLVALHVAGGLAILALVLWRLWLRYRRGAPPPPEAEPAPLRLAARAAHVTLYALMVAMPLSGAAAWFSGIGAAAALHGWLRIVLLMLIGLHVLAVLAHQLVFRTSLMQRMWRAEI